MAEAAAWPVLGTQYQSAEDRIPVDVPQFLGMLAPGAHVEVVEASLPELPGSRES